MPKKSGTRDPIAQDLRTPKYRKRIAKSGAERAEQQDAWSKKAKHKKAPLAEAYYHDIELTPENYVIEWVKRGRKNNIPLQEWEQAFQDAGMIEQAWKLGYIHIGSNVGCDISLEPRGRELVAQYYDEQPTSLSEFYQVGDKVEIVKGPLSKVLARAEKIAADKKGDGKKAKKEDAVVRDPHGPAGTIGITVDGEYHLIDEEDVKLIFESSSADYEDLTEWSYAESSSGIRVLVSSEEQDILKKCASPVRKSELDDRDQEVARRMVSRGVLHRRKDADGVYFVCDNHKLTRF